jgi:hypothetical protein
LLVLVASAEEHCRQHALNPIRERRARLARELASREPEHAARARRSAAAVWLGSALVRLGERLGGSSSGIEIGASQSS